jgi:hypothetical protein
MDDVLKTAKTAGDDWNALDIDGCLASGQRRIVLLLDLKHIFAARALARILADRTAFAGRAAAAHILADGVECSLFSADFEYSRVFTYRLDFRLGHRLAAGAVARLPSHHLTGASLPAVAGVDFIPGLEGHLALALGINEGSHGEEEEYSKSQGDRFSHNASS